MLKLTPCTNIGELATKNAQNEENITLVYPSSDGVYPSSDAHSLQEVEFTMIVC